MPDIREIAQNRWPEILTKLGADGSLLDGKHRPCPSCCGTDRFRFDDKNGIGTHICSQCGAGDGFELVRKMFNYSSFKDTAKAVEDVLGIECKPPSKDEQRAYRKRLADERGKREKEESEAHRIAAIEAQRIWDSSSPASDDNVYLKAKGVKAYGVRQSGSDLIIPVRIGGKITSIHESTGDAVAISFNAGNLKAVAQAIRAKLPDIEIIIAGDNDKSKTGELKGRAAAEAVGGKFIMPEFVEGEAGSDWNDYASIHGLNAVADAFQNIPDSDPVIEPKKSRSTGSDKVAKPSQACALLSIVENQRKQGMDLFHDASGTAFATVTINGVSKTLPVRGKDYRNLLRRDLYQSEGRNASAQAIDDALGTIEGIALLDGIESEVNLRVAADDHGAFWVDLGDEAWQSVKITGEGWDIVNRPGVKWRRPGGMRALPIPVKGGEWQSLFDIFPMPEDEQVMVIAWLLMTFNPSGPYPLLILQGEQGTGKSTLSKILRGLIDPNIAPIRTAPRNEHDLIVAARNGWIIAVDNLSGVPPWLSDGLCRLATGGGFSARALYSNDDEHIIEATRPCIINGIDDMAARPDLADRAIVLNLEHIDKRKVRTERELMDAYEAARPRIIGALLDAVSTAIKMLPETHIDELPRMADFALFVTAAESALWEPGTFIQTYNKARAESVAAGLDGSPVATSIRSLMAGREAWKGTATYLLDLLPVDEKTARLKIWPKTARGLSNVIRRLAPLLRADGINIEFKRDSKRLITITSITDEADDEIPSDISQSLSKKGNGKAECSKEDNACISASVASASSKTLQNKGKTNDATDAEIHTQSNGTTDDYFNDDMPVDSGRVQEVF